MGARAHASHGHLDRACFCFCFRFFFSFFCRCRFLEQQQQKKKKKKKNTGETPVGRTGRMPVPREAAFTIGLTEHLTPFCSARSRRDYPGGAYGVSRIASTMAWKFAMGVSSWT